MNGRPHTINGRQVDVKRAVSREVSSVLSVLQSIVV